MKNEIEEKPISVIIKNTDLEMMRLFVGLTDKIGLYDWDEGHTLEQKLLKDMRSLCCDVSWVNRDKNPYEMEVV